MSLFPRPATEQGNRKVGDKRQGHPRKHPAGERQAVKQKPYVRSYSRPAVGVLHIMDAHRVKSPVEDEVQKPTQPGGEGLGANPVIGGGFLLWGDAAPAGGQEQLYGGGIFHLFSGGLLQGGFLFFA